MQVLEAALAKLPAGTQQAVLSRVSTLASPSDREKMLKTTTADTERAQPSCKWTCSSPIFSCTCSWRLDFEYSPEGPWLLDGVQRWTPRVQCKDCERVFNLKPEDVAPSYANAVGITGGHVFGLEIEDPLAVL